eukprot:5571502-Ditylum_brightwellii.AAC.1
MPSLGGWGGVSMLQGGEVSLSVPMVMVVDSVLSLSPLSRESAAEILCAEADNLAESNNLSLINILSQIIILYTIST